MHPFLFTGLAFATAGSICALVGDLLKRPGVGLLGFLALTLAAWARLIASFFGTDGLLDGAALFLLAHVAATLFYLGTMHFLDSERDGATDALALRHE